jgi:crossover junction endodeoxyribonuclease RuvC
VRVFGIDPGSDRTGYGCVETDGSTLRIVLCGAITTPRSSFPLKLRAIYSRLTALIDESRPDCVAIENLFYATNVRSALQLGHARGVAMLAAVEAGVDVFEYTPTEIKRAVVGYGRAEKPQVQHMVARLLGLTAVPSPNDAADALAVAICHVHSRRPDRLVSQPSLSRGKMPSSWRAVRLPAARAGVPGQHDRCSRPKAGASATKPLP